jgi:LmbE family N-acetylglucosaminyl deacetylase
MGQRTVMAVFAHPDDEAFGTGGTLARYAAEGCYVYLVTATRGEAGEIADEGMATSANLPYVREREIRCACQAYGIHEPRFLDYVDGQLPQVHQGQAVGKLVRLIRELRPQVVITFGPDGIYGHYDHIAVHRWVTIAYRLAADEDCFPDQIAGSCRPHQVDKLYFRVLNQAQVEAMTEDLQPAVMMDGVPFFFKGYPPGEITTVVDVSDYVSRKLRGIQCHETQLGRDTPFVERPEEIAQTAWFKQEHFILAQSTVGPAEDQETDLFARLSEPPTN